MLSDHVRRAEADLFNLDLGIHIWILLFSLVRPGFDRAARERSGGHRDSIETIPNNTPAGRSTVYLAREDSDPGSRDYAIKKASEWMKLHKLMY